MSSRSAKRKGSVVIALVAMFAVLATLTPASAAPALIVAGPGSAFATYYTPLVVQQKGKAVTFVNLDFAPHDVRHTGGKFHSATIGIGKKTKLIGVENLPKGTYKFYCTIHPIMKGTLRII